MSSNEEVKQNLPDFFVYGKDGMLDWEGTLQAVPAQLDKKDGFFRDVPEWFEVTPSADARAFLENLQDIPEGTKEGFAVEDLDRMNQAFEKVVKCTVMYEREDLTASQKEFLRCLNYYTALYAMDTMPVPDEEPHGEGCASCSEGSCSGCSDGSCSGCGKDHA